MKTVALAKTTLASGKREGQQLRGSCRERRRAPRESLNSSTGPGAALLSAPGQLAGVPRGPEGGNGIYPTHLLVYVETHRKHSENG